jgi:hypothetical protein
MMDVIRHKPVDTLRGYARDADASRRAEMATPVSQHVPYSKAQLFQFQPERLTGHALMRADPNDQNTCRAQEMHKPIEGRCQSPDRVLPPHDERHLVLAARSAAGPCGGRARISTSMQFQENFRAIATCNDRSMRFRDASELDHGVYDPARLRILNQTGSCAAPERERCRIGWDRCRSGGSLLERNIGGQRDLRCDTRATAQIELENARNHDDGLWPMSILKQGDAKRVCALFEQAATTVLLILDDPIAVIVLTDKEERQFRGGRFVHDPFPFL